MKSKVVIYQAKSGAIELKKDTKKQTVWATQAQIASIFEVGSPAITKHLKNIYSEQELSQKVTCSKMEQVQIEGKRMIKRTVTIYNLDAIISVGYRISSKTGTRFRQWATKILRQYILSGFAINKKQVARHYERFQKSIKELKGLLPAPEAFNRENVLELITAFADTWLSLDAYDKDELVTSGLDRRAVAITAEQLSGALTAFKQSLVLKEAASALFGQERVRGVVAGIVGNVMQSFSNQPLYPTLEEKAAQNVSGSSHRADASRG